MSVKVNKICIFRDDLFASGGIETWLYNIASIYGKSYDITIYYGTGDKDQIFRLSKKVKCIQHVGQQVECDIGIWCYDFLGRETTKAKKAVHIIHADYSGWAWNFKWGAPMSMDMDEIYAVSKLAANSASKMFRTDVKVLYNPVLPLTPERSIKILSATRLSQEKGLERIRTLVRALDKRCVDYHWDIYTPSYEAVKINSPNVTLKKPVMNILNKIKEADFVVQLSDTESFGYSIVETMSLGTNLVVTGMPIIKELGINKDNAIIVPLKCKNYNSIVDKILNRAPYVAPVSDYATLFGPPSLIHYNPITVKNISKADTLIGEDRWLEPGQVGLIEDYDGSNPALKVMK